MGTTIGVTFANNGSSWGAFSAGWFALDGDETKGMDESVKLFDRFY
jgi:hypothetical protein